MLFRSVVEGVRFAVVIGAECGAGGSDEIGQTGAKLADLTAQLGDRVERRCDGAESRRCVVVACGCLLKISVRVMRGFGRDDRLLWIAG